MRPVLVIAVICLSVLALSSCKIKIVVPKGGEVRTQSEALGSAEGTVSAHKT